MSNYQKFTLATIKEKLKNGEYSSLTGANRAIGKTQELSETDKVKAKALAAKHFGVEESAAAAPKKTAKKVAKAPAAKKVAAAAPAPAPAKKAAKRAKKTAKKAAKKGARAAKSEAAAPSTEVTQTPAPATALSPKKRGPKAKAKTAAAPPVAAAETAKANGVGTVQAIISTIGEALKSMELARSIYPKAELAAGVAAAADSLAKAVRVLDTLVPEPLSADEAAKPAPAAVTRVAAPAATDDEVLRDLGDQPEGVAAPATELSEEEAEQLRLARETQTPAIRRAFEESQAEAPNPNGSY